MTPIQLLDHFVVLDGGEVIQVSLVVQQDLVEIASHWEGALRKVGSGS